MPLSKRSYTALCLSLILLLLASSLLRGAKANQNLLKEADNFFANKEFQSALVRYEQLQREGKIPPLREPEIELKIVTCLIHAEEWDRALRDGIQFAQAHKGTVWEARGLVVLAQCYLQTAPYGATNEGITYRGKEAERVSFSQSVQHKNYTSQDNTLAFQALEAALLKFPRFRKRYGTLREEIEVGLQLANLLKEHTYAYLGVSIGRQSQALRINDTPNPKPMPFNEAEWRTSPNEGYSVAWKSPKKLSYLYEMLKREAQEVADREFTLARVVDDQVAWLMEYHTRAEQDLSDEREKKLIRYPYQSLLPIPTLQTFLKQHKTPAAQRLLARLVFLVDYDTAAPLCKEALGILEKKDPWRGEIEQFQKFVYISEFSIHRDYSIPRSDRWKDNADGSGTHALKLRFRNHRQVTFSLYTIPPSLVLERDIAAYGESLSYPKLLAEGKKPMRVWTESLPLLHREQTRNLSIRVPEAGWYFLKAEAGKEAIGQTFCYSRLQPFVTHKQGRLYCYVVDSVTGQPLPNTELVRKSIPTRESTVVSTVRSKTDGDGWGVVATEPKAEYQRLYIVRGKDITSPYNNYSTSERSDLDGVIVTDRKVYRPNQKCYYRAVVLKHQEGHWVADANRAVTVKLKNPEGNTLQTQELKTNRFGGVHGEMDFGEEAALGNYSILVENKEGKEFFRESLSVEEYKKPEVEVTATPETPTVSGGQKAKVNVQVNYYSGGAVPYARVRYLIGSTPRFRYWEGYREESEEGSTIQQGILSTDAQGHTSLSFDTKPLPKESWGRIYTVHVEVQDSAHHTLTADASVEVISEKERVSVSLKEAYGRVGDPLHLSVETVNSLNNPVSHMGELRFYRSTGKKESDRILIKSLPFKTDKAGEASLLWTPEEGGEITIFAKVGDRAEERVYYCVVFQEGGKMRLPGVSDIRLFTERRRYRVGETVKALLVLPDVACPWRLFVSNQEGFAKPVELKPQGQMMELSIPFTQREANGLELQVVGVKEGQVYNAEERIDPEEEDRRLQVTLLPDKTVYLPGQQANMRLHVQDAKGKPLSTELSLALTDSALDSIRGWEKPRFDWYLRATSPLNDRFDYYMISSTDNEWVVIRRGIEGPYAPSLSPYTTSEWRDRGRVRSSLGLGVLVGGGGGAGGGMGGMASMEPATGMDKEDRSEMAVPDYNAIPGAGMPGGRAAFSTGALFRNGKDGKKGVVFRSLFADLAHWTPSVVTDAQGDANLSFTMPENLARWRAYAFGNTEKGYMGEGEVSVTTHKDLLVRLETPRFLVEQDKVVLSGIVQNSGEKPLTTQVRLDIDTEMGSLLPAEAKGLGIKTLTTPEAEITVPAKGERRVDWLVQVKKTGNFEVALQATADKQSDGMRLDFPVLVHGIQSAKGQSGVLREQNSASLPLAFPANANPLHREVIINVNPSLATVMLDALPYLADYPYGCVEQTLSRFVPSLVVERTLSELGYKLDDLRKRAEVLEKREQTNPKATRHFPFSPYTYPTSYTQGAQNQRYLQEYARWKSPVFSEKTLRKMAAKGLERLGQMQHTDGGWGWWEFDRSDPYMTTYVVQGLLMARQEGKEDRIPHLGNAFGFLQRAMAGKENVNLKAYQAWVLAQGKVKEAKEPTLKLLAQTTKMTPLAQAMLVLALEQWGEKERAKALLSVLEGKLSLKEGVVSFAISSQEEWHWYFERNETLALVLQAELTLNPNSSWVEPIVHQMLQSRRNLIWDSTRATAQSIQALALYLKVKKELSANYTLTLKMGDRLLRTLTITPQDALFSEGQWVLKEEELAGLNGSLTLSRQGTGTCYYSLETRYFPDQERLASTESDITIRRSYVRLVPTANAVSQVALPLSKESPFLSAKWGNLHLLPDWSVGEQEREMTSYRRVPFQVGDSVQSGDLIEVEMEITSKQDYDYVMLEDIKPAGCEAVEKRSEMGYGGGLSAHVEVRDQKLGFFFTQIDRGTHKMSYRLRAEALGRFRVLPTLGYAMYAPGIRANSQERQLGITEVSPQAQR